MFEEECVEDWLDVLILGLEPGDQSRQYDQSDWKEYFCVLEREPPAIRIFLDEQEYDDYQNYPSPVLSPHGRRPSYGDPLNNGPESVRKWASLGDLISPPERPTSPVSIFRRRLSSGLGNLLALGRLEKVIEERNSKPKRWRINHKGERPKTGLFVAQTNDFPAQQQESAAITDSVDLAVDGNVEIRAVHPSIIGHQYCFVISNSLETKYFSCRSSEEMSKWIGSVKKALDPSRDLECRTDISLSLWIVEAKGLTNKKRYFCELLLDNAVYAKSTGKPQKNDTLFWGEQFFFEDLPELSMVQINVHKDYDKKKKKDKTSLIGTIDIPTNSLALGQEMETWYSISPVSTNNEGASLRIRTKYQRNLILPLGIYNELLEFLKNNYSSLCHFLEPVLSAKAKDEIAKILVRILQSCGTAKEFLIDLVTTEMEESADENLLFRGNSFATKAMDYYMKMVGEEYLEQTLGAFVKSVYDFDENCEVDPSKISSSQLEANQENIKALVQKAWNHIVCSSEEFPRELVDIFSEVRNSFPYASNKVSSLKLISGTVFLRFLVPAILSPSLFGLAQEYPDEYTSRTLTLVAKVIQNLANGLRFDQSKEGYLEFMNYFIDDEKRAMREFLQNISTKGEVTDPDYNGSIDLGKELSAMQNALNEQIDKLDKESLSQLSPLQFVLETLNDACQNPDAVGVFNPNSLILSKHTLSANLYKKLATKTPADPKLDHSKKASALRTKPEFHDAELSDGREDATRNIIIKETKKRNQRYYDMRSGSGLSRDSSEYSSESPRSRHGQPANFNTPHSTKRKNYARKTDVRNRSKTESDLRSAPASASREFPTSDLGEDFLSSGEGNSASVPPLQKLTVRYVNPTGSAKSASGSSGGSKWTGSDYGSLPRNFEKFRDDNEIERDYVEANVHEQKLVEESCRTPLSEPEDAVFTKSRDYGKKHHSRSLEDIISVHSDSESTRVEPKQRPRSFVARDAETVNGYEIKSLNVDKDWNPARNAPSSPILRRIDKFKRQSVSSSSSGASLGAKTNSRETLEREDRNYSHHPSKDQTTFQGNVLTDNDDHIFGKSTQPSSADVSDLRRELQDTKLRLSEKQRELNEERAAMKRRQLEIEEKFRREQDAKDKELRAVYERLSMVEQQLRDQQTELEGTLKAKNVIIQAQEQRIRSLNTDYNKLLEALNQLQKTPSVKSMNIRITDNL